MSHSDETHTVRLTLDLKHGGVWTAPSPIALIQALKLDDWSRPQSLAEFKENVQHRCAVAGTTFVYWDSMSFLLGWAEAQGGTLTWDLEVKE